MGTERVAGWAGVLSGIGLAAEAYFFMASGWSAAAFSTLDGAGGVMREGGRSLRLAVVFGVFNLALLTLFFAGLASRFRRQAPALGDAVLYFGLVGIAIHALVPIAFYHAVPTFSGLKAQPDADAVWLASKFMMDVAQGAGIFFMGLAMLAAGVAWATRQPRFVSLAVVALAAGGISVFATLAVGTKLEAWAGSAGMASLFLSIVFRLGGGLFLLRSRPASELGREAS